MIQRIQSVYLLVAGVFGIVGLFMPIAVASEVSASLIGITVPEGIERPSTLPIMILQVILALVTVGVIFLFNNRTQQMKLAKALAFMWLFAGGGMIWIGFQVKEIVEGASFSYSFGIAFPLVAAILSFLASKAIKKDEDLIKSVDRLR